MRDFGNSGIEPSASGPRTTTSAPSMKCRSEPGPTSWKERKPRIRAMARESPCFWTKRTTSSPLSFRREDCRSFKASARRRGARLRPLKKVDVLRGIKLKREDNPSVPDASRCRLRRFRRPDPRRTGSPSCPSRAPICVVAQRSGGAVGGRLVPLLHPETRPPRPRDGRKGADRCLKCERKCRQVSDNDSGYSSYLSKSG